MSRRGVSDAERAQARIAAFRLDESPGVSIQKLAAQVGQTILRVRRLEQRLGPPRRRALKDAP